MFHLASENRMRNGLKALAFLPELTTVFFLALCTPFADAQETLGQLLDVGGVQVQKKEVVELLSGAHVSGQTLANTQMERDFEADGSFAGRFGYAGYIGVFLGFFGTWAVNDQGRVCTDYMISINASRQQSCWFLYRNGNRFFLSPSDTDKDSRVLENKIQKKLSR